MNVRIKEVLGESIQLKQAILADQALLERLQMVVDWCIAAFQADKKVLFCGNGGSASDAQHLAAEFSGRFYKDRPPLFSEALHVNTSFLTAVANDYDFTHVYARAVEAQGRAGDVLIAISTSGNSPNVLKAVQQAQQQGLKVVAMTGQSGGKLASTKALLLNVPSTDTPRIQEAHILLGHIICELVESALF